MDMDGKRQLEYVVLVLILMAGCVHLELSRAEETDRLYDIIDNDREVSGALLSNCHAASESDKMAVNDMRIELAEVKDKVTELKRDGQDLKHELMMSKIRYNIEHDIMMRPMLSDVVAFLEEDGTNYGIWSHDYDCTQFSYGLVRRAIDTGMFACIVCIDFDEDGDGRVDSAHNIVAFDTLDAGVIYVEPQSDDVVYMSVGMNYWCAFTNGDCGKYIVLRYDSCFERVE